MTDYRYEYGKRWNAKLPRNSIKFLVHRIHCDTPDVKVQEDIRLRCVTSNISTNMHKACMKYALCVHNEQRNLYHDILRGRI